MKCVTLVQNEATLHVQFTVSKKITSECTEADESKQYKLGDAAFFQLKVVDSIEKKLKVIDYISIRFYKEHRIEGLSYTMKLKSPELGISDKRFTTDDGRWHLICEKIFDKSNVQNQGLRFLKISYTFTIELTMCVISRENIIAILRKDHHLTDFELRGTDGSVPIHKAVLAAASPVFHRMLTGPWEEVKNGYVVMAVTKTVLENFKNYLYLGTPPDSDLEWLVLLASRYMMAELEQMCVFKLVQDLTAVNIWDTLEFAITNKVLVAIAFYATGSYQTMVGDSQKYSISQPSVSKAIRQVTKALNTPHIINKYIAFLFQQDQREQLKRQFYNKFKMPGLLACGNGTHVAIVRPSVNEERYFNRKGYHSLNVMIICDSNLNILCVYASYPGSTHDSVVWANHPLFAYITRLHTISGEDVYLLGDSGYPLRPTMMIPFTNLENDGETNEPVSPETHYQRKHTA